MSIVEQRLSELGITLPSASNPAANYTNCVEAAGLLFVSGKVPPPGPGAKAPKGKLGREFTTQQGYEFARSAGLDILAAVKHSLGDLDRILRVVKLQGFVNATEDFEEHPQVLNGCSDLMVQVFGDKGVHARSVLGAASLRGGIPIVIESVFALGLRSVNGDGDR
jgi:enamine deaminase RidA (YjgF/YER057c/UK114 family)